MRNFRELNVWKDGRVLVKVYTNKTFTGFWKIWPYSPNSKKCYFHTRQYRWRMCKIFTERFCSLSTNQFRLCIRTGITYYSMWRFKLYFFWFSRAHHQKHSKTATRDCILDKIQPDKPLTLQPNTLYLSPHTVNKLFISRPFDLLSV